MQTNHPNTAALKLVSPPRGGSGNPEIRSDDHRPPPSAVVSAESGEDRDATAHPPVTVLPAIAKMRSSMKESTQIILQRKKLTNKTSASQASSDRILR